MYNNRQSTLPFGVHYLKIYFTFFKVKGVYITNYHSKGKRIVYEFLNINCEKHINPN
jgi:hypothetical protein